jgi:hypothetical protein
MKHSAKAAARLERERAKQERRSAGRRRAGRPAGSAGQPAPADGPGGQDPAAGTVVADPAPAAPGQPGRDRGLRAAADRVGAMVPGPGVSGTGVSGTGISGTGISGTGAAGQAAHQRLVQLPYAIVLAGTVAGLVLMQVAKDAVRGGTLVIAGALLAASLTRLVLPEGRAGLLGSRRRLVDVALLTALGAGLLTAGLIVQVPG